MNIQSVLAVLRFELRRFATVARLAWWIGLALFPPAILSLFHLGARRIPADEAWLPPFLTFVLTAGVVNLLGLLLAATPAIHSELEARTWSYLAVRPHAKGSVVAGKYLAAVLWSGSLSLVALGLCVVVAPIREPLATALRLAGLVVLASLAYGALYIFISVVFLRRAMVAAVAYTLLAEVIVAFVPAVVREISISHHLIQLLPWDVLLGFWAEADMSPAPARPQFHVSYILGYAAVFLALAVYTIHRRELVTAEERQGA